MPTSIKPRYQNQDQRLMFDGDRLLIKNVNDDAAGTVHVGYAVPGTAAGDDGWQITEIVTAGTLTTIRYCDGNEKFDNVWTGFAGHSYS
jgi:hypothetical protein